MMQVGTAGSAIKNTVNQVHYDPIQDFLLNLIATSRKYYVCIPTLQRASTSF